MRNALTLLGLIVWTANCAPPKRSIACINPDPVSGACRDAELLQAEKDEARRQREQEEKRISELKQAVQLANTQLAEKKAEIAAEDDPAKVTQLIREHDALVATIISYQYEAKLNLFTDLGPAPLKLGEPEQLITLHLQQDEETGARLPILGGLDTASEVQVSYLAMQHKFPTPSNSTSAEDGDGVASTDTETQGDTYHEFAEKAQLPATLRIPLQLSFILNKARYCGSIVIDQKNLSGGKVETRLADEGGC